MTTRDRILRLPSQASHAASDALTHYRFEASLFPVNAYLVETPDGVIVVDTTLGVSDGRALRARVQALNKPLRGVIITHTHPDHYGGFHDQWLENLRRAKRELPDDISLLMGHGQPATGKELLDWQINYITRFREILRAMAQDERLQGDALTSAVTTHMKTMLPSDDLLFLMQLSIEPVRAKLLVAEA